MVGSFPGCPQPQLSHMVFLIKLIWTKIVKSVLKGLSARLCFLPDGKKRFLCQQSLQQVLSGRLLTTRLKTQDIHCPGISHAVTLILPTKNPDWLPHQCYMVDPVEFQKTKRRICYMAADKLTC
jgi:hypothetical protein